MIYNLFIKYFSKKPKEDRRNLTYLSKAEGECPVKVVGIPEERLENIFEISPELQRRLESIASPRAQGPTYLIKKY